MITQKRQGFLLGGGEMGKLFREKDWTSTSVGSPESWPATLQVALNILLNCGFPMCIWWGNNYIPFYNDAYLFISGANGKPSDLLGLPGKEWNSANWHHTQPFLDQVMNTGEVLKEDQLTQIHRNGKEQEICMNFSYSPLLTEQGSVAGVLAVCSQTIESLLSKQKLSESDATLARFQFMADHSQDPFILIKEDASFAYLNEKAREAWGYTKEESSTLSVSDVEVGYCLEDFSKLFTGIQAECSQQFESFHKRKDGTIFPVRVILNKLIVSGVPYLFAVARDISEHKKYEQELSQSVERFNLVAKATQDAIWDWDLNTNALWWNEGFRTLFHYEEKEIESTIVSWYSRVHPDDKDRVVKGIHEIIDKGEKNWSSEYRFRRKDGSYAFVLDRGYVLHNTEGKADRMLGSMQDISVRKQYEDAARENEERTRLAIEAAHLGTFEIDLTAHTIIHSRRAAEIIGLDPTRQWPYQKFKDALLPEDLEVRKKAHQVASNTGRLFYEARIVLSDNSIRWVRLNGALVNNNKKPVLIGTMMDITQEKKAAELLEQKIEERTKELQQANDQLKHFTYAASHDLQEPLRKISYFSNRLLDKIGPALNDETKMIASRIQYTTNRMRILIENLLNYSNTATGITVCEQLDLTELVKEVLSDMEATIIQEGAIINLQSLPSLKGDQAQLRQLFQNLVGNALKYHKKGESPLVDITCEQVSGKNFENYLPIERREGNYFLIQVKDNGIGFEQEYAEQIFTLFQRLHGKAEYEGSGIGLSIVQKVVENHKGIVWAESLPNEGAVFKVLLPKE